MKQTIQLLKQSLSPLYDSREVKAITRMLLEEVCGLTYTQIVMQEDRPLPEEQRSRLARCAQELSTGVPVQQVLGYEWFRGRKFEVNPEVLIPRPETAELVNMVVDNFVKKGADNCSEGVDNPVEKGLDNSRRTAVDNSLEKGVDNPVYNLVDIGTGSGCIALSLAADIHHSFITSVDLSTGALITAERNSKSLGINNIRFVQADILKEEEEDFSTELSTIPGSADNLYDAIVSNPPYICNKEAVDMSAHVLEHEPHMALFVPDGDPLLFYRVIAKYGKRHLRPGGGLYFEINEAYGKETCELLYQLGYEQVRLIQDFNGKDRFVTAQMPLATS